MKNPLNRRFLRELKGDFGKYLIIFLFMVIFVGAMSGFFVAGTSVVTLYRQSQTDLNLEDGHISFDQQPQQKILDQLEQDNHLTFYPLNYKEETLRETDNTIRIYADRDSVNLVSLYAGAMPSGTDEIALDRMYAQNNQISIGDIITVKDTKFTVSGTIALPDYSALFENNSDMMFDSVNFGVAILSSEGYAAFDSAHETINYAWLYNEKPADDTEADQKFDDFTDSLEEIIKEYDEGLVQAQVDTLYDQADVLSDELRDELETASDKIEAKIKTASQAVYLRMMADPTADSEQLLAEELGTTKAAYKKMISAFDDAEDMMDDLDTDTSQSHEIDFDALEDASDYENDMDFSLDGIYSVVDAVKATGIYPTEAIYDTLSEIQSLMDFEIDEDELLEVTDILPSYVNQAVNYVGTDGSSDRASAQMMTWIIMGILALVFAITISNTITKEAAVIGTLRASGYSRGELVRHYMVVPVLVTVLGCAVGNLLGYTVFSDMFSKIYYMNYSLPVYKPLFNADAFIQTTVVPLILTVVINLFVLIRKLRLKPLDFIRGDLKNSRHKLGAIRLSAKLPFLSRFRLRILFQNSASYLILVLGIFVGGVLAVFGFMFTPMLDDYAAHITDTKFCNYQYVLAEQVETENTQAEKYCITTLSTNYKDYLADDVSVYGVNNNSAYIKADISEGEVAVSSAAAAKYHLETGDTFEIKDKYSDKVYSFVVGGEYEYDAAIAVFMTRSDYLSTFDEEDDYFSGYLSNELLTDIAEDDVATIIDSEALTKLATQLSTSFGSFMTIFQAMGGAIFALLMFVLIKQIIEKNIKSISMTKILGFTSGEIAGLYLVITSFVVLFALLISVPVIRLCLKYIMNVYIYKEMSGYIPFIVSGSCYVKTILLGIICYIVVALGMMVKIRRLPKGEVLKNQSL